MASIATLSCLRCLACADQLLRTAYNPHYPSNVKVELVAAAANSIARQLDSAIGKKQQAKAQNGGSPPLLTPFRLISKVKGIFGGRLACLGKEVRTSGAKEDILITLNKIVEVLCSPGPGGAVRKCCLVVGLGKECLALVEISSDGTLETQLYEPACLGQPKDIILQDPGRISSLADRHEALLLAVRLLDLGSSKMSLQLSTEIVSLTVIIPAEKESEAWWDAEQSLAKLRADEKAVALTGKRNVVELMAHKKPDSFWELPPPPVADRALPRQSSKSTSVPVAMVENNSVDPIHRALLDSTDEALGDYGKRAYSALRQLALLDNEIYNSVGITDDNQFGDSANKHYSDVSSLHPSPGREKSEAAPSPVIRQVTDLRTEFREECLEPATFPHDDELKNREGFCAGLVGERTRPIRSSTTLEEDLAAMGVSPSTAVQVPREVECWSHPRTAHSASSSRVRTTLDEDIARLSSPQPVARNTVHPGPSRQILDVGPEAQDEQGYSEPEQEIQRCPPPPLIKYSAGAGNDRLVYGRPPSSCSGTSGDHAELGMDMNGSTVAAIALENSFEDAQDQEASSVQPRKYFTGDQDALLCSPVQDRDEALRQLPRQQSSSSAGGGDEDTCGFLDCRDTDSVSTAAQLPMACSPEASSYSQNRRDSSQVVEEVKDSLSVHLEIGPDCEEVDHFEEAGHLRAQDVQLFGGMSDGKCTDVELSPGALCSDEIPRLYGAERHFDVGIHLTTVEQDLAVLAGGDWVLKGGSPKRGCPSESASPATEDAFSHAWKMNDPSINLPLKSDAQFAHGFFLGDSGMHTWGNASGVCEEALESCCSPLNSSPKPSGLATRASFPAGNFPVPASVQAVFRDEMHVVRGQIERSRMCQMKHAAVQRQRLAELALLELNVSLSDKHSGKSPVRSGSGLVAEDAGAPETPRRAPSIKAGTPSSACQPPVSFDVKFGNTVENLHVDEKRDKRAKKFQALQRRREAEKVERDKRLTPRTPSSELTPHLGCNEQDDFGRPSSARPLSRASNRKLVRNALTFLCLAGAHLEEAKSRCLKVMDANPASRFILLLAEGKSLAFKGLYIADDARSGACGAPSKIYGAGPPTLDERDIVHLYKYDSAAKAFRTMHSTNLGSSPDAVSMNPRKIRP